MERQLWAALYRVVTDLGRTHACAGKQFSDAWIALTFLWSVVHDRPRAWACDPANWPPDERWHGVPSARTLGRRLRTVGVLTLVAQAVQAVRAVRDLFPAGPLKLVDGKPLPVGGYSRDADATYGHAAGVAAVGYKLHYLGDARCPAVPDAWAVAGMAYGEQPAARGLLRARAAALAAAAGPGGAPWGQRFGYLAADNGYDANALYDDAAALLNWQLVAPPRPTAAGLGHRAHSPGRLRGLELARGCHDRGLRRAGAGVVARRHPLNPLGRPDAPPTFGQAVLAARGGIERTFGTWGNWGGGLGPLPNWVRRPRRVALWVAGKILLNGVRAAVKQGLLGPRKQRLVA